MGAARGDTRPCTHAQCQGTMQFSREPLEQRASGMTGDGDRGWVCSQDAAHFERASERGPESMTMAPMTRAPR